MPYLICSKCDIYYEVENKNEMKDWDTCTCGNELIFYETIENYLNEEKDSPLSDENGKGMFYSVDRKKLVNLEMNMLKEQKEREELQRSIRDLRYRIKHAITKKISDESSEDENLKKKKLLKEIELLKRSEK